MPHLHRTLDEVFSDLSPEIEEKKTDPLRLVSQYSTVEQIQSLLLRYAPPEPDIAREIRRKRKPELISELRNAMRRHVVPASAVYGLLRQGEEDGSQHIFYYRLRPGAPSEARRRCAVPDLVAASLWSDDWRDKMKFPRVQVKSGRYDWVDFRCEHDGEAGEPAKDEPAPWRAKIYGREQHFRFTGEVSVRDDCYYPEFEITYESVLCLARWNPLDLLEIRVSRTTSRKLLLERRDRVWNMLSPALGRRDFEPWDLTPALQRLLAEYGRHKSIYRPGNGSFVDSAYGREEFTPNTETEDLLRPGDRRKAVTSLLHGGECRVLAVTWLPDQAGGHPNREVRSLIGLREPDQTWSNEVLITRRVDSRTVDYVTAQLQSIDR